MRRSTQSLSQNYHVLIRPTGRSLSGHHSIRRHASSKPDANEQTNKVDVEALLNNTPAWDISQLLPPSPPDQAVTKEQLHHLHRLCALPPPKTTEEETRLMHDLSAQLHFMREIQKTDTTGVTPLSSLRDETTEGIKEATIGLEQLKEAFAQEENRGSYNKKIRRRTDIPQKPADVDWDPLKQAKKKLGRYFVVDRPSKG